ncbi:MAG TPA: lamin tail domain-containing protein [Verrucomicrobiales bacterium]|nr:lamin tail domain-containing protein [Verrucomicrobiales bacterium]
MRIRRSLTTLPAPCGLRMRHVLFCAAAASFLNFQTAPAQLRINEFGAVNSGEILDEDGETSDWIELHNPGLVPIELEGWSLADNPSNPRKWTFSNRTLPAGGYLIVFASGKDRQPLQGPFHTVFRLNRDGESLLLTGPGASGPSQPFQTPYPPQREGFSYGLAADGSWHYFPVASPGQPNPPTGVLGFVSDPQFSAERGLFEEPFDLALSCDTPGSAIVYTTDGDLPSLFNGTRVSGPDEDSAPRTTLRMTGSTVLRAMAQRAGYQSSPVRTHTYLFPSDVVRQSPNGQAPPGWPASSVNGQVFDYGMDPEIVDHHDYRDSIVPSLRDIPSLSVVTGLSNLIHPLRGIYVNAQKDGRTWERPASFEWLRADGLRGFQIDGGLRIRGGFSRGDFNPKHSFRVFFRQEYGAGSLRYPLFETEGADRFEKIDLRTAQNYAWSNDTFNDARRNTFLREVFARDTQAAMGQPYTRSRYLHLYLNGLYWGLYMTQERSEADYAQTYFGGRSSDYDVVKVEAGPYTIAATDGDLDAYARLHSLAHRPLEDADFYALQGLDPSGNDDPGLERHLDPSNLIDYMLVIFYTGSFDAPLAGSGRANNFYAVRNRNARDAWRFFCHDLEHSMLDVHENRLGPFSSGQQFEYFNPQWLHQQLAASPAYRLQFADHVRKHFFHNGILTPEQAAGRWQARRAQIELAIIAESARWGDQHETVPYTRADWAAEASRMVETWFPARTGIVFRQFQNAGLYPSVDAPDFSSHGGYIDDPQSYLLRMTAGALFNPMRGNFFYTTDGSDPRLPNGEPSPEALVYDRSGPGIAIPQTLRLRARLLHESGAWSALTEATFYTSRPAAPGSLAITEIMYHPADSHSSTEFDADEFEFLEIGNLSHERVSLEGVRLEAGVEFDFSDSGMRELESGAYLVVVRNAAAFASHYGQGLPVAGSYGEASNTALSNGGEGLRLSGPGGVLLHEVFYSDDPPWPAEADGGGFSLVSTRDPASGPDEWRISAERGGSPARPEPSAARGISAWMSAHGISDLRADPDHDGWNHFAEYVAGSDPFHADGGPELAIRAAAPAQYRIEYLRRDDLDGAAVAVETSTDLRTWAVVPPSPGDESGPATGARLHIQRHATADPDSPQRYFRLRISADTVQP